MKHYFLRRGSMHSLTSTIHHLWVWDLYASIYIMYEQKADTITIMKVESHHPTYKPFKLHADEFHQVNYPVIAPVLTALDKLTAALHPKQQPVAITR